MPFRAEKVITPDDMFDEKNFEYDFHKHEEKYIKEIQQEIKARGLDPRTFNHQDIQKEIERRMKDRDIRKGTDRLRTIGSHYCQRIANKLAFYVQKVHDHDILRMDLDFFKDENDDIWLFHANNIIVKNNEFNTKTQKLTGLKLRGQ